VDLDDLPDGLPPGRLLAPDPRCRPTDSPVCWVSQPLADAPQQWARLHAIRDRTGLWPVLLRRIVADEPDWPPPCSCDPGQIDALDAETILRGKWDDSVRGHRQIHGDQLWMADGPEGVQVMGGPERPPGFEQMPEGVRVIDGLTVHPYGMTDVVFVEERGKRFGMWPRLAPPGPAQRDPDAVAREIVVSKVLPRIMPPSFELPFLGLVPVARSADISAIMGWAEAVSDLQADDELSAVLRSWEHRFGAQVVALAPPLTRDHAEHLALEHLLLCPEVMVNEGDWTFSGYVDRIIGSDLWKFRWDD
jgi:hypothetical protein